jgi:hypothetical protein
MGDAYECPGSTLRLYLQSAFKTAQILLRAMASPSHLEKGGLIACIKWASEVSRLHRRLFGQMLRRMDALLVPSG